MPKDPSPPPMPLPASTPVLLQYLWNLKDPPEQELESEGKRSTQIDATQGISYSAGISLLST
jgi:hypothetical protein